MKQRWAALATVVALSVLSPRLSAAQGTTLGFPGDRGAGQELGQNMPNPFVSETRIPFTLGDYPTCSDPGRVYRVSLRIYNILSQLVAVPVMQEGTGNTAVGAPLDGQELTCGQYTALWDAKFVKTQQEVPPGIYLYRLEIDGRAITKKMISTR